MRAIWRFLLWFAGIVSIVLLALRLTVLETWKVPDDDVLGLSIAPTLVAGDLVVLRRGGERTFGELVRCTDPEDAQRWVVGRLVGLEGDTVEVDAGGTLRVNGTRYGTSDACQVSSFTLRDGKGNSYVATCARVEMAGGWHFRARVAGEAPERASSHEVGPGRVFLASDNRTLHDDSRDFGAIEADTCKEAVLFRRIADEEQSSLCTGRSGKNAGELQQGGGAHAIIDGRIADCVACCVGGSHSIAVPVSADQHGFLRPAGPFQPGDDVACHHWRLGDGHGGGSERAWYLHAAESRLLRAPDHRFEI